MNAPDQPCPSCGSNRPAETQVCPACGHNPAATTTPRLRSTQRGWLLFFVALFLPAILTLLFARSEAWPFFTFFLSGVTALYCGFWSAAAICRDPIARVVVGLVFSAVAYVVSFFLCCAGCAAGGANLNFH